MPVRNEIDKVPIATRGPRRYQVRNYVDSDDSSVTYRSSRYGYDSKFGSTVSRASTELSTIETNTVYSSVCHCSRSEQVYETYSDIRRFPIFYKIGSWLPRFIMLDHYSVPFLLLGLASFMDYYFVNRFGNLQSNDSEKIDIYLLFILAKFLEINLTLASSVSSIAKLFSQAAQCDYANFILICWKIFYHTIFAIEAFLVGFLTMTVIFHIQSPRFHTSGNLYHVLFYKRVNDVFTQLVILTAPKNDRYDSMRFVCSNYFLPFVIMNLYTRTKFCSALSTVFSLHDRFPALKVPSSVLRAVYRAYLVVFDAFLQ